MDEYDHLLKIVVTGDSTVGKTCMLSRYVNKYFNETYTSTIGVDFKIGCTTVDNTVVKLQIWDTAGQERYKSIVSGYYRNPGMILIIFDLSSKQSFNNISMWYNKVEHLAIDGAKMMLVGCKSDLSWAITIKDITDVAELYDMPWCVCSSLDGSGIEEVFVLAVHSCIDTLKKNLIADQFAIHDPIKVKECCTIL